MATNANDSHLESAKFLPRTSDENIVTFIQRQPVEEPEPKKTNAKCVLIFLMLLFLFFLVVALVIFLVFFAPCATKKTFEWYNDEIVYQIEVSNFKDSDGNGIGDIEGLIQKLDYIDELGAKTIIISRFNSRDSVKSVDAVYGNSAALERLRFELNKRKMHLIVDLPLSYLKNSDKETVEFWLKNYADGIRLTNIGDDKIYSSVKIQKLANFVKDTFKDEPKYFGVNSEETFTNIEAVKDTRFLKLSPKIFQNPSEVNTLIKSAYESKNSWPNFMLGDFNTKRIKNSFENNNLSKLVHGLVMLLKGTPFLLFGDEIELKGSNEIENTMQWDNTKGCGFTDNEEIANFFTESTQCQNADRTDLKSLYKDLKELRSDSIFTRGEIIFLENKDVISFIREGQRGYRLVLVNTSDKTKNLDLELELLKMRMPFSGRVSYTYSINKEKNEKRAKVEINNVTVHAGELLVLSFRK